MQGLETDANKTQDAKVSCGSCPLNANFNRLLKQKPDCRDNFKLNVKLLRLEYGSKLVDG